MLVYRVNQSSFLTYSNFCDSQCHQTRNEDCAWPLPSSWRGRAPPWRRGSGLPAVGCPAEGDGALTQSPWLPLCVVLVSEVPRARLDLLRAHGGETRHEQSSETPWCRCNAILHKLWLPGEQSKSLTNVWGFRTWLQHKIKPKNNIPVIYLSWGPLHYKAHFRKTLSTPNQWKKNKQDCIESKDVSKDK